MAKRTRSTMNISIPIEQKKYVAKAVRSGRYQSASEVVRASLRELEKRDAELRALHKKLEEGRRAIDRGDVYTVEEVMGEWARRIESSKQRASKRRRSA